MWSWAATSASSATQCPSTATPLWPGTRSSPTAKPSSRSSGVHRQFPLPCKAIKIPLDNRGHNSTIHICMQSPNTKPSGPCLWASPYCQDTCSLRLPMCDYHGSCTKCSWLDYAWTRADNQACADGECRDYGGREDRQKARLMWLVEDWGADKFREMVGAQMGGVTLRTAVEEKVTQLLMHHRKIFPLACWLAMPCALGLPGDVLAPSTSS